MFHLHPCLLMSILPDGAHVQGQTLLLGVSRAAKLLPLPPSQAQEDVSATAYCCSRITRAKRQIKLLLFPLYLMVVFHPSSKEIEFVIARLKMFGLFSPLTFLLNLSLLFIHQYHYAEHASSVSFSFRKEIDVCTDIVQSFRFSGQWRTLLCCTRNIFFLPIVLAS